MAYGIKGLLAACVVAMAAGGCATTADPIAGGALAGAGIGAGIGAAAGGPHGALVGAGAGAATGAIVAAARQPPRPEFAYVETLPACPHWRDRAVRSSSDAFDCRDERGWRRPRRASTPPALPEYPTY